MFINFLYEGDINIELEREGIQSTEKSSIEEKPWKDPGTTRERVDKVPNKGTEVQLKGSSQEGKQGGKQRNGKERRKHEENGVLKVR